jgi:hypothetical protein
MIALFDLEIVLIKLKLIEDQIDYSVLRKYRDLYCV